MHYIDPISSKEDSIWYLSVQDVCKIGRLFVDGLISTTKIITMGGPGCINPSYLEVFDGTPVSHINDEIELNMNTDSEDIEEWDSLNQIKIILACEKEFSVSLNPRIINSFSNIGEMVEHLKSKNVKL